MTRFSVVWQLVEAGFFHKLLLAISTSCHCGSACPPQGRTWNLSAALADLMQEAMAVAAQINQ